MSTFTPGVHTHRGSCRCGAVRFEVDLDLAAGTTQCNCTYCKKSGWWGALAKPEAFRLLAGPELPAPGGDEPYVYRAPCATCGLLTFGVGDIPELGGPFVSINLRSLDDVSLDGVPIRYLDGLHDTWATVAEAPYVDPFAALGPAS